MTKSLAARDISDPDQDAGRQVLARAAAILKTLEAAPEGLTVAEITRRSGLPRTTVARLVGSLNTEQFVAVRNGLVRLGPALLRLASAANLDAATIARPHLEALQRATQETVHLWMERPNWVELVDEIACDQEVRIMLARGTRLALESSAPGKAFLALQDDNAIRSRLGGTLERRTSHGPASMEALLKHIEGVRRRGIAADLEEHAEDVCAIAKVVALGLADRYAVAIAVPARRFGEKRAELEAALENCANALGSGR